VACDLLEQLTNIDETTINGLTACDFCSSCGPVLLCAGVGLSKIPEHPNPGGVFSMYVVLCFFSPPDQILNVQSLQSNPESRCLEIRPCTNNVSVDIELIGPHHPPLLRILSSNGIEEVEDGAFDFNQFLTDLDFRHNRLQRIPNMASTNIESL